MRLRLHVKQRDTVTPPSLAEVLLRSHSKMFTATLVAIEQAQRGILLWTLILMQNHLPGIIRSDTHI